MKISLIAACDQNRLIGDQNRLPWRLPADLQHFKQLTLGKTLLMGRLTFESIGRPLPQRRNLVLSRQAGYQAPGIEVVPDLQHALRLARQAGVEELMVIGGSQLYRLCLPWADRLYLTEIDACFNGDAWFPELTPEHWHEVSRTAGKQDPDNVWPYQFVCLERIKPESEPPASLLG